MQNERYNGVLDGIYNYLATMTQVDGAKPTHVSLDPKGSYYIDEEDQSTFYSHYNNIVKSGYRICIAEYPQVPTIFRLDIDIVGSTVHECEDNDAGNHMYTKKNIKKLVGVCQDEIKKLVNPSQLFSRRCIVLEKSSARLMPSPEKGQGKKKDGLHIQFPELALETWSFEYLCSQIEARVNEEGIFDANDIESVTFDKGMSSKVWLMYGSSKSIEQEPYIISMCFSEDGKLIESKDFFRIKYEDMKATTKRKLQDMSCYYPRFLSIRGCKGKTQLSEIIVKKKKEVSVRGKRVVRKRSEEDIMKDLVTIKSGGLMDMLSIDRIEDHDLWMDVGWTLFNVGEGNEEALDLWVEFSERNESSHDRSRERCETLWQKMDVKGKTIGSILAMARQDDPEKYQEWKNRTIKDKMDKFLYVKCTEGKLAELTVSMYKDRYVCANASKNVWYEFSDHRWRKVDQAITLKRKIYEEVKEKFIVFKDHLKASRNSGEVKDDDDEVKQAKNKEKEENDKKQLKMINDIIAKLEDSTFLNKIVEMCKLWMHDDHFFKKLDKCRHVVGCENGVLDLNLCIFREGRPDDYVSKSTGIYYKDYKGNEPEFMDAEMVLRKVYPNERKLQFIYDVWSMALGGKNTNKMFIVSTGRKDAGKSGIHSLFGAALGDYNIKSPAEVIQKGNKNTSGAARPEMMRLEGCRSQIFDEISDSKTLDIDAIKRQTGNDPQWFRGLFDNEGQVITPMYVTFLQCNVPPRIPSDCEALWGRMQVVEMDSLFSHNAPESEDEQWDTLTFPADPDFDEKIPVLAPVILWKIFNNYPHYKKKRGIIIPEEIKQATQNYRTNNDVYMEFITENIEKELEDEKEDEQWVLDLGEIYTEFKGWCKDNYPSLRSIPEKNLFKRQMCRRLGPLANKTKWHGYRLATQIKEKKIK